MQKKRKIKKRGFCFIQEIILLAQYKKIHQGLHDKQASPCKLNIYTTRQM